MTESRRPNEFQELEEAGLGWMQRRQSLMARPTRRIHELDEALAASARYRVALRAPVLDVPKIGKGDDPKLATTGDGWQVSHLVDQVISKLRVDYGNSI